MSYQYDEYLREHKDNVRAAADWLWTYLPDYYNMLSLEDRISIKEEHDASKYREDEYDAYDAWFYGKNPSAAIKEAYEKAWLTHIHRNPHHWQYWVLIHDDTEDGNEKIEGLEMDYRYVIEMICDWWSFSFAKGNLYEIFDWYEKHKDGIMLHPKTRALVEKILSKIEEVLNENQ